MLSTAVLVSYSGLISRDRLPQKPSRFLRRWNCLVTELTWMTELIAPSPTPESPQNYSMRVGEKQIKKTEVGWETHMRQEMGSETHPAVL
jgi:hypothetical protein